MDTAQLFVTGGGILLIVFILWFFFGGREEEPASTGGTGEAKLYSCPMHPWITSDDPAATCSICGMKLVR